MSDAIICLLVGSIVLTFGIHSEFWQAKVCAVVIAFPFITAGVISLLRYSKEGVEVKSAEARGFPVVFATPKQDVPQGSETISE